MEQGALGAHGPSLVTAGHGDTIEVYPHWATRRAPPDTVIVPNGPLIPNSPSIRSCWKGEGRESHGEWEGNHWAPGETVIA